MMMRYSLVLVASLFALLLTTAAAQTSETTSLDVIHAESLMRGAIGRTPSTTSRISAAIAINPDYAYAYASRCESRRELNADDAALGDCSHAIELSPHDPYAYRERALIYLDDSDADKALQDAQEAVDLDGGSSFGFTVRCRAYVALQRADDAIRDCTTALQMGSAMSWPNYFRGLAEIQKASWSAAAVSLALGKLSGRSFPAAWWCADLAIHACRRRWRPMRSPTSRRIFKRVRKTATGICCGLASSLRSDTRRTPSRPRSPHCTSIASRTTPTAWRKRRRFFKR